MAGGRKHHAVDDALIERWALFGTLCQERRVELGYKTRRSFAETRLPRTRQGNVNERIVIAVENNERQNYSAGTLREFARALDVTRESVYAVLDGKADKLVPAAEPPAPAVAVPAVPFPPVSLLSDARWELVRPYFMPLLWRIFELDRAGNRDPSAADLGLSGRDADAWRGSAGTGMALDRRALIVADLAQRRRAGDPASGTDART